MKAFETVTLSEIVAELESGSRPQGGITDDIGDVFSLGGEHLNDYGEFDFSNKRLVPFDFYQQMKRGIVEANDILIVKDGATTGKVAYVREGFPYDPCCINEHLFRLAIDGKKANSTYVFYYLLSPLGNAQVLTDFRGATVGGISQDFVSKVEIALPPLPEQKRIAAILEKADRLRRLRRHAREIGDTYLQSVFLEMFGDPATNPKGWDQTTIGDLAKVKTGGTPSRAIPSFYGGQIPWVKTAEVIGAVIWHTEEKISEEGLKSSNCEIFPVDTIVVAMYGQGLTRGRSAKLGISAATNQACAAILPSSKVNIDYLWSFLRLAYSDLRNLGRGGNQPNLNLSMIREFTIPSPPLPLQQEFARIVERYERLRAKQREAERQADHLFQTLLHQAFQGEL